MTTRQYELWECPDNNLLNHAHVKKAEHLVLLAQECWDTDQVLFSRELMPRGWLPVSESTECAEVGTWESDVFGDCVDDNLSPPTTLEAVAKHPKAREVAFGVATFPPKHSATHLASCSALVPWEDRCRADRLLQEPSFKVPSKSSVVSTKRLTSSSRLTH